MENNVPENWRQRRYSQVLKHLGSPPHTCRNTYADSGLDNSQSGYSCSVLFSGCELQCFLITTCVWKKGPLLNRAEQKWLLIKRKCVVEGICVLLCRCVLSLLNLWRACQAAEQRGAGHISGIQQLDDSLLILSPIPIFLYTGPISHLLNSYFLFFLFER